MGPHGSICLWLIFIVCDWIWRKGGKEEEPIRLQETHLFTEIRFKVEATRRVRKYLLIWWDRPGVWCVPVHPHVCDLFLLFATGSSEKGKRKSVWVEWIKNLTGRIPQGEQRTQGMRYYHILGSRAQGGRGRRGRSLQWRRQEGPARQSVQDDQ